MYSVAVAKYRLDRNIKYVAASTAKSDICPGGGWEELTM